jgi:hypothetical protein
MPPSVTVKPINTINVRVNQNNRQIVKGTTQFIGATDVQSEVISAFEKANTALINSQNAYEQANSANSLASTKVNRSGDTMTQPLYFQTDGGIVGIGDIQTSNVLDLYSSVGTQGSELNYANTNYVFAKPGQAGIQTPTTSILLDNANQRISLGTNGDNQSFYIDGNNNLHANGIYYGVINVVDGGVFL